MFNDWIMSFFSFEELLFGAVYVIQVRDRTSPQLLYIILTKIFRPLDAPFGLH